MTFAMSILDVLNETSPSIISTTSTSVAAAIPKQFSATSSQEAFLTWRKARVLDLCPVIVLDVLYMLFGVVGNSVVCYICLFRMRRNVINTFVLALALLELLGCVFTIPVDITEIFSAFNFDYPILCKGERYFRKVVIFSTFIILVAIAVERYRRIVKPYDRPVTLDQVRWTIIWALAVSLIISVPEAVLAGSEIVRTPYGPGVICSTYHSTPYRYSVYPKLWGFTVVLIYVFSIATIGITYFVIASKIWQRGKVKTDRRSRPNTPDTTLQRRVRHHSQFFSRSMDLCGSTSDVLSNHNYVLQRLNSYSVGQKRAGTVYGPPSQRHSDFSSLQRQPDNTPRHQKCNSETAREDILNCSDINCQKEKVNAPENKCLISHVDQSTDEGQSDVKDKTEEVSSQDEDDLSNDSSKENGGINNGDGENYTDEKIAFQNPEYSSGTSLNNIQLDKEIEQSVNNQRTRTFSVCSDYSLDCQSMQDPSSTALLSKLVQSMNQPKQGPQTSHIHYGPQPSKELLQPLTLTPLGSFRRNSGYSRKRTTFIMFVMTLTSALSHLPHVVAMLYSLARPGVEAQLSHEVSVIYRIVWNSFFISLATHPFVYGFWNGRFKHALYGLLIGLRKKTRTKLEKDSASSGH